jgi:hypothetical protein
LKPERWGSPLVQEEKYQEKPVKREEEIQFISFIYVLDNSQIRLITATHQNNSTG